MPWIHRREKERAPAEDAVAPPSWPAQAVAGLGHPWLRVDAALRVVEASAEAVELFEAAANPEAGPVTLITFTRTAAVEEHAREVVAGASGDWDLEAPHFRRWLRLIGVPLPGGAFLLFDDLTELRRLEAVRKDFVTNLAHELRTPVASLSLAVETLQANDLPEDERRRFVQRVAEETRYIEGLLRTVTELAVLEGQVRLSEEAFSLREVVEESWRRVVARQGEAALANRVGRDMVVVADRIRIAEVLQNLLENAHRYNPADREVEVSALRRGSLVEVAVRDHGQGIPPADLPRVFERFYKVDRARTRRELGGEGSGLGLAIARHLVLAHGGRIWAEAADGGGTTFAFELPSRD